MSNSFKDQSDPDQYGYRVISRIFEVIWYSKTLDKANFESLSRGRYCDGLTQTFTWRNDWKADDTFVAFKGGNNQTAYAQWDIGQFIFEKDGVRWCIDPGGGDQNIAGYWTLSPTSNRYQQELMNNLWIQYEINGAKGKIKWQFVTQEKVTISQNMLQLISDTTKFYVSWQ